MASDNTSSSSTPTATEAKSWLQRSRVWLILVIALVLSNVGTFLYQNYQQNKLKETHAEQLAAQAGKAEALVNYRVGINAGDMGHALLQTVQSEMVRNNKELLDRFLISTVQETEVELVAIVDSIGMVYLSTNKKFENKFILDVLPGVPKQVDEPQIIETKARETIFASPIMAPDHRKGTLVMTLKADAKTEATLKEIHDLAGEKEQ